MPARAKDTPSRTIAFVASCLNEEGNVAELHRRCLAAFESFTSLRGGETWHFAMTLADNGSSDGTAEALRELAQRDSRVQVLINARNYGAEASVANASTYTQAEIMVLLNSDLQDPPELAVTMLEQLDNNGGQLDAVLACKQKGQESPWLSLGRSLYYLLLGYSSRLRLVPSGFHGFGAYRREAIEEAIHLWETTGFNLRLCLVNGCHAARTIPYRQEARRHGRSSYEGLAYPREAMEALLTADSTASRMAFILSGLGVIMASGVGCFLLLNWLGGNSRYEPGLPTVMALVLGSFAMQMLITAVLSRQVEELRYAKLRPRVRHQVMSHHKF